MTDDEVSRLGPGRRRALLIATSKFLEGGLDDLPAAKNDLVELTTLLRRKEIGNFEVTSLLNIKKEQAEREVERLFKVEAEPDDFLLLYITGHGVVDDGRSLWFALRDYRKNSHRASALEARWIRDILESSKSNRQLIIIDTCYSGMFVYSKTLPTFNQVDADEVRGAQDAIVTRQASPNSIRYYIFACGDDELAYSARKETGRDQVSRLTSLVVSSLKDGSADKDSDGLVSLDDLWSTIEEQSEGWQDQRPRRTLGLGGRAHDAIVALSPRISETHVGPPPSKNAVEQLRRERKDVRRELFWKRHHRSALITFIFLLLIVIGGAGYLFANRKMPIQTLALTAARWQDINTDGSAAFHNVPGGILEVKVPSGHLQWYGLYYAHPRSCNYTLRLEARQGGQTKPSNGSGWGYGLSIQSRWSTSNSSADGWTIQDEYSYHNKTLYGDVRVTQLANVNSDPYAAFYLLPNTRWNLWTLAVQGNIVSVKRDHVAVGRFPISNDCGGVFLRVWSETVQFRNMTLTTP